MTEDDLDSRLSRTAASDAVETTEWRYLLGTLALSVRVRSLQQGLIVASVAMAACEGDADEHLRLDLRRRSVELSLQDRDLGAVTGRDTSLAHRIADALRTVQPPGPFGGDAEGTRPVQQLELAIDAVDITAIRPFWKAVLRYVEEPDAGPEDALIDPVGQLPTVWFQQMDAPRPQRNRIHLDLTVSHEEADARVRAALDAGGRLLDDSEARAFWVLADAEGNEVCICTWQDRDQA